MKSLNALEELHSRCENYKGGGQFGQQEGEVTMPSREETDKYVAELKALYTTRVDERAKEYENEVDELLIEDLKLLLKNMARRIAKVAVSVETMSADVSLLNCLETGIRREAEGSKPERI
tara:strand:- start:184 stop:543 length:360 start_codon:yes stop_codon:yes gene_type:complete